VAPRGIDVAGGVTEDHPAEGQAVVVVAERVEHGAAEGLELLGHQVPVVLVAGVVAGVAEVTGQQDGVGAQVHLPHGGGHPAQVGGGVEAVGQGAGGGQVQVGELHDDRGGGLVGGRGHVA